MSNSWGSMPNINGHTKTDKVDPILDHHPESPKLTDVTRSHVETKGWEDGAPPKNTDQTLPHRDGSEGAILPALERLEKNSSVVPRGTILLGFTKAAKTKKGRCWSGYEPVPGKKPYSEDSCRKKTASISEGFLKAAKSEFHTNKPLYQPRPSTRAGKKYMVYVKGPGGGKRLIHFGATGYRHNYSEGAKKNFRARHNCDGAQKDTAKWWACNYLWNKKQDIGNKTYDKVAALKLLGL